MITKLKHILENSKFSNMQLFAVAIVLGCVGLVVYAILVPRTPGPETKPEPVIAPNVTPYADPELSFTPRSERELEQKLEEGELSASDLNQLLPYSTNFYTISNTTEADVYTVSYAPYLERPTVLADVLQFFLKANILTGTIRWDDGTQQTQKFDLRESFD